MNKEKTNQALEWYWRTDERYYTVKIERDLLGDWVVLQRWGGRFNQRGGDKNIAFQSLAEALEYVEQVNKRRISHHYELVESPR